jgi:hypothetical protein
MIDNPFCVYDCKNKILSSLKNKAGYDFIRLHASEIVAQIAAQG